MNEPAYPPAALPDDPPARPDHSDELPAVEPPSAGFIVQLFLIPALIVGIIVLVYVLFGRIAGSQRSPEDYLKELKSANDERRWCAAREVASILPHDEEWQANQGFARGLADELAAKLSAGATGEMDLQYQKYLAMALGEFKSRAGIPTLCQIIQGGSERDLRAAAILSLGRLGDRLGGLTDAEALTALTAATKDEDSFIRKMVAFALGSIGQAEAVKRLQPMLNDSDREVRYNAACAIARLGSTSSLDTIQEMLDIDRLRALGLPEAQLSDVPLSALRSLLRLIEVSGHVDLELVRPQIKTLTGTGTALVQITAKKLVIELETRADRRKQG